MLGVTLGDPNGVGPEILLKAFQAGRLREQFVAFGDLSALEYCNEHLRLGVPLREARLGDQADGAALHVVDAALLHAKDIQPGQIDIKTGAAARQYVVSATEAALKGEITAMVTLPVNKEAVQLSDPQFTGHTELIGSICGAPDVTIMLVCDQLIVTHVSTHCSLREAIDRVRTPRIRRIIELTWHAVSNLRDEPRLAVAGLNPHAGENGLFGSEDADEIAPAVQWAREQGFQVDGPLPPDTVFFMAVRRGLYDAVVCMYHDQGHIAAKILDFESAVNVTLGLPIIRTSVDHGTAFDIAYTGRASTLSFEKAFSLAGQMAGRRAESQALIRTSRMTQ